MILMRFYDERKETRLCEQELSAEILHGKSWGVLFWGCDRHTSFFYGGQKGSKVSICRWCCLLSGWDRLMMSRRSRRKKESDKDLAKVSQKHK